MDRRSFLRNSALGGSAAAASSLAAPAYAQGRRTLTMVTAWSRGLAGVHDSAQYISDRITEATDGQLTIELNAAGEIVGAFDVFDAVTAGQADIYHAPDYYFIGQHPAYSFYSSVPFGMTALELNTWYYHGGGRELHDELGQIFGLKSFLAGNTGAQTGGWYRNEITSPEDFEGLRYRMPGQGGEVLSRLGASIQNLPGGEVYQALSSGALDGTDWIGPWADEAAGFQEITDIYYPAGFAEPGPAISLATNREVFEDLSPAHQTAIEQVAAAANIWTWTLFQSNNAAALQRLQSSGVSLHEFPESVWDAFGQASREVREQYTDDELYSRIYESYMSSLRETSQWYAASEETYLRQRNRFMD